MRFTLRRLGNSLYRAANEASLALRGRWLGGYNYSTKSVKFTRLKNGYQVSTVAHRPEVQGKGPVADDYRSHPFETAIIDPQGEMHVFGRVNSRAQALRDHARAVRLASTRGRVKSSWSHHE